MQGTMSGSQNGQWTWQGTTDTGGERTRHTIQWRDQDVTCCGQRIIVADGSMAPVWFDRGQARGGFSVCLSCGGVYVAKISEVV